MKKLLLFFIFLSLMFGFEIRTSKTFKIEYLPKKFNVNINIIIIQKNFNQLMKSISNIPTNNNCKIKNYYINPIFNKNNSFQTYKSVINMQCIISSNSNNLDKFLKKLSSLGKININSIYATPQNFNNILKIKAYNYGNNFAKKLSKKLNYNCYVKSISFNNQNYYPKMQYKTMYFSTPNSSKTNYLKAFYLLECIKK